MAVETVPITMSVSSTSQSSAISNPSSQESSPDRTQACGLLRIVILTTDTEEAPAEVGEISVPASSPQLLMLQDTTTGFMMQAVTSSVINASQMEAGTAASPPIDQDSGSRERWPRRQREADRQQALDHRRPESEDRRGAWSRPDLGTPMGPSRLGGTPPGATPHLAIVETGTWEELEEAAQLSVQGTAEGAMDYALAVLGQALADIEDWFQRQSQALHAGQRKGEDFGHPDHVRRPVGWMRHLWDHNTVLQRQIQALKDEKEELIDWQTKATDKAMNLHNRIKELEQEREQLRQQLEDAWAGPPVAVILSTSTSVDETMKLWKELADRLNRDGKRI